MENMKGVIFGFDDVLLDTESNLDWLYRIFWKSLAEFGIISSPENLQKIYSKNLHSFDRLTERLEIHSEDLWETSNKDDKRKMMR